MNKLEINWKINRMVANSMIRRFVFESQTTMLVTIFRVNPSLAGGVGDLLRLEKNSIFFILREEIMRYFTMIKLITK